MPLSERGIEEIARAAEGLDLPLSVIPAHILFRAAAEPSLEPLQISLIRAGATMHFPTVVLMDKGRPVGNAWAGFKDGGAYRVLLEARLAEVAAGRAPTTAALARGSDPARVRLLASIALDDRPGAFYRRVPGTRYIAFDLYGEVWLHHIESGERLPAPGRLDFVASPDGLLFVTPGFEGRRGLHFYLASEIIRLGATEGERHPTPLLVDSTMTDEYPSVGLLLKPGSGIGRSYRVLTAWYEGAAYRDYALRRDAGEDAPSLVPLGPRTPACPGRELSLPMLSKDGTEMSARDEETGTVKVFRIGRDTCEEVFDTGMQTSKATFSPGGELLAFGASRAGPEGALSTVYVADRRTGEITSIPYSHSASLTIPEFVGPDSLLFLVGERARGGPMQLRLVCCVGRSEVAAPSSGDHSRPD